MNPYALFVGFWWIFPIIMIAMMIFCFFIMRRCGMCQSGCCAPRRHHPSDENRRPLQ